MYNRNANSADFVQPIAESATKYSNYSYGNGYGYSNGYGYGNGNGNGNGNGDRVIL